MTDPSSKIRLSEMIQALRVELGAAATEGDGQALRFEVGTIKLSAEVQVSRTTSGGAGVEFWVVKGGVDHERGEQVTHRVEVTLEPIWDDPRAEGENPTPRRRVQVAGPAVATRGRFAGETKEG